jgi:3-oxoacyl-[acyl-carrier protein] reductase
MSDSERLSGLSRSVKGHAVFITGAGSGIGRATAHLFADEGARVAVTDLDGSRAGVVADEITASGGEANSWALDVSNRADIERVVAAGVQYLGGLDVLVNNAGVSIGSPIDSDEFPDAWDRSLDVMVTGAAFVTRAALGALRESDQARIVNTSSTEGVGGSANIAGYSAAKHAIIGLTRSLAVELGGDAITVNAVCPGPIHTGMTEAIPDEMKTKFARRRVPLKRYGQPEELAHAIVNLSLPSSSYVTGHAFVVDGGMTIKNN